MDFQQTIGDEITLSGVGLHTGNFGKVTLKPAEADSGIVFRQGTQLLEANWRHVVDTRRCTVLGSGDLRIGTVEHMLSALNGLAIDNAVVEIEGEEVPAVDGSAAPFVQAIRKIGLNRLSASRKALRLKRACAVREGDSWLVAAPSDDFSIVCVTEFEHPLLGLQGGHFDGTPESYEREVAPARTFGFATEVEALRSASLARGGSLENAIVIFEDRFSGELRYPDECLRHKVLDLFGDLTLVGHPIKAAITAIKPSHRANVALARMISEEAVSE